MHNEIIAPFIFKPNNLSSTTGDNININATLIAPIAMEEGLRFAIREGGRTVGAGVVSKIIA